MSAPLFFLVAIKPDELTRLDPGCICLDRCLQKIVAEHLERYTTGPIPEVLVTQAEQTFGLANQVVFRERAVATTAGPAATPGRSG